MTPVHRSIAVVLVVSIAALGAEGEPVERSFATWSQYLGGVDSSQYSSLTQIDKTTVSRLDVAWRYPSGDSRSYRFNPIVVDDTMYVLAKSNSIVALDARTGQEKWTHPNQGPVGDRGINYWESGDRSDRRLLYLNAGALIAIDARTGETITSFGDNGRVDVRTGLNRDLSRIRSAQSHNPGRIYGDLIIVALPAGGASYVASPGDIHAYDVRTGKLAWVFHTVPEAGEFGADTWPESALATGSGVHNWAEMTVDEARGIVYIPTGTARYDFYGGDRHGDNLYGNSIVALDARTGRRIWHFQTIHHDLWDYDLATAPKLLTVRHEGRDVDVVAQASKQGFLYVLERDTGRPLWPIEERPVPQSDVPGERTAATQPFPTLPPPFARQSFTEKDINPYLPEEQQEELRRLLRSSVNKGIYTPPSLQGSIQMPGNSGGANWGLAAVDPVKGRVFVMSKEAPSLLKVEPMTPGYVQTDPRGPTFDAIPPNAPEGFVPYSAVQPYGFMRTFGDIPPIGPPWSQLTAYDLNEGTIIWQVPNGDMLGLAAQGIHGTGSPGARAGMIVTAGGLVFIGTPDHRLRAYDEDTGKVVWEHEVNGPIDGVPATYEVGGRQYLVVAVGAPEARGDEARPLSGSEYVVFALPARR